jgi:RNA polymerase sigma-70 factor (ECF subfamily)
VPSIDLKQFKALVEPHLARLYRMAWRLTANRWDAEDLLQECCLRAWESFPEPANPALIERWLFRVLYHRFVDEARHRQASPVRAFDGAAAAEKHADAGAPTPEDLAQRDDGERRIDLACAKLERDQRVLLSLRAEGYGLVEIEAITGIGRDVLRARLHRARQSFARHLRAGEAAGETPTRIGRQG